MTNQTTWTPDTCGCSLTYSWDTSTDETNRVHTPVSFQACPAHPGFANAASHYAGILGENQRKNKVINKILTNFPALTLSDISWTHDQSRNLIVSVPSLTANQKTAAMTAITNMGVTNVTIV